MKLLFVCEYNACRSQMAEGLARALLPHDAAVYSAGLHDGCLNVHTVEVMGEIGIDLSGHRSKKLAEVGDVAFDLVVVLAEAAWEATAVLQARQRVLWPFPDPVAEPGEPDALKQKIRRVRDTLKEQIGQLAQGKTTPCATASSATVKRRR